MTAASSAWSLAVCASNDEVSRAAVPETSLAMAPSCRQRDYSINLDVEAAPQIPVGLVPGLIPAYGASRQKEDTMADNIIPAWINLGSLVLLAALVADFSWVFYTAINAH